MHKWFFLLVAVLLFCREGLADPIVTVAAASGPSDSYIATIDPNDFTGGYDTIQLIFTGSFISDPDTSATEFFPPVTDTGFNALLVFPEFSGGLGLSEFGVGGGNAIVDDGSRLQATYATLGNNGISDQVFDFASLVLEPGTMGAFELNFFDDGPQVAQVTGTFGGGAPELLGDFNEDGVVDAADYATWRNGLDDDLYDLADYDVWRDNFGSSSSAAAAGVAAAVPEPHAVMLGVSLIAALGFRRQTSRLDVA